MNDRHEQDAQRLNEVISSGAECHDPALLPFNQVADALKRDASTDAGSPMDESVKRTQRSMLLSMAQKTSSAGASAPAPTPKTPKPSFSERFLNTRWLAVGGFAVAACAIVLAFVVTKKEGPQNVFSPKGVVSVQNATRSVSRLFIPEAHAGDAFSILVEKKDAAGVDVGTSFLVTSTVDVDVDELKQHLVLVPAASTDGIPPQPVDVSVENLGNKSFRVRPAQALAPGKVYQLAVETAVQKENGDVQQHDFSWAIQTKNTFRVTSSVPGPNSSGVPVNSGIEFVMSMTGWEDPTPYFSITPKVEGSFEAHGRSMVFVPKKPLDYGQLYTVTLKKGWKVAKSDLALASDIVVRFETVPFRTVANQPQVQRFNPQQSVVVGSPNKEIIVPVWGNTEVKERGVTVTGYLVSEDEARQVLLEDARVPEFAEVTRREGELFERRAKQQAFQADGSVDMQDYAYNMMLHIPNGVPAGHYVVKIMPKAKDAEATWFYLESTKIATYSISDAQTTVIWAMNTESGLPVSNATVSYPSASSKTNEDGIARIQTPAAVLSTSTSDAEVVKVADGNGTALIRLESGASLHPWWDRWTPYPQNGKTITFLAVDRPLYRTTDKLMLSGLAQDRASKSQAGKISVELVRAGIWDWFSTDSAKVYQHLDVTPDAAGFFRGSLEWRSLAPGYYTLSVKRDGQEIYTRSVEVRDFVKPAYTVDVVTTKNAVYAGDTIEGEVRAQFFDGTPVPDLEVLVRGYGITDYNQPLKTDATGRATFSIKTPVTTGDPSKGSGYGSWSQTETINVAPTQGEEGEIWGTTWVNVWRARVSLDITPETKGEQATINFKLRNVDLTRAQNAYDTLSVLADPVPNAKLNVHIIERRWDRIDEGTGYDFVEKRTYPKYRYEMREREVASTELMTNTEGKANLPFTMATGVSYRVYATTVDSKGSQEYAESAFSRDWGWMEYSRLMYTPEQPNYSFEQSPEQQNKANYKTGEDVSLSYYRNSKELTQADASAFLYVKSIQGIKDVQMSKQPRYRFTYGDQDVPNVTVRGIVFIGGGFLERSTSVNFDQTQRALEVKVDTDKTSYAPGGKAVVHVSAKKKDGSAAAQARVSIALVDEAVYVAAQNDDAYDPLSAMYGWIDEGVLLSKESHYANPTEMSRFGGAEMGGGGGAQQVRRNFKDTADFQVVTLDGNGQADMPVDLPDNITSWRVTAVAATPDLYAGTSRGKVVVTKPVFVDVVAPAVLLSKDHPVIKLRAYGTGLGPNEAVTYTVDAPTLGLKNETVTGKANASSDVTIASLPEGEHAMTIRVTSAKGTDAIEKKLKVVGSRFQRNEQVTVELGPGTSLGSAGTSPEVDVTFLPQTRAKYAERVRQLSWSWGQRVESRIAANIARQMLAVDFQEKEVEAQQTLTQYQSINGGIMILPYASDDVELTSKVAAVDPKDFDRVLLSKFLWETMQNKEAPREQQVRAVSGLAALGEPVLPQLQDLARLPDLSWHEQLAVARGLTAIGDQATARDVFNAFMAKAEKQDTKMFVRVSNEKRDQIEATAEAAAIAVELADPRAAAMDAWLETNWHEDAFDPLDRIAYLSHVVPAAYGRDASVTYAVNGAEQTVSLKSGYGEEKTFTADEMASLRITKVDGPVVAVFTRRVTSMPKTSPDISIDRKYEPATSKGLDALREGEEVRITITPTIRESAPSGCYTVRDHLPAGLVPMQNVSFGPYYGATRDWYPVDLGDGSVSFVFCKGSGGSAITYRARVITRGEYTAEPAVLQSEESPSVTALTQAQAITIK